MAAGNFTPYNDALERLGNSTDDWDADSHYAILLTNSHTAATTHSTLSDISANEVSDADYAPQDMSGEAVTETTGTVTFDASDVSFGDPVTITARHIAVVKGTVSAKSGTDPLIGEAELETTGDVSSTNGPFDVNWNASGLMTLARA